MKEKLRHLIKKAFRFLPWALLLALGVHFSAQLLADWHYREFTEPFVKSDTSQKLNR